MRETAVARDESALRAIAARFAASLEPGATVTLSGSLGAGKTAFVRAAVEALHGTGQVSSPTFTIRHRYEGTPPIDHLDFYRIEEADVPELGLDDAFAADALTFVEWPERAASRIPAGAIRITIAGSGDLPRTIEIVRP
jgi:tRNA threonylcarbamoyl adenosine modification protein YjeE